MEKRVYDNRVVISDLKCFDLEEIFTCGQCFRFRKTETGWEGCAKGRYLQLRQNRDKLTLMGVSDEEFETVWKPYFGLDEDYVSMNAAFRSDDDPYLKSAARAGCGIRILRQDPWEMLCTFILSQNNNIPRITSMIAALSERYGEKIGENGDFYTFPDAKTLYENASVEGLKALKFGFRAKYVIAAAEAVACGRIDLDALAEMDYESGKEVLCTLPGVGPKVASCALLYGFHRMDAFPVDVWMQRVLDTRYPQGLDVNSLGENAGLAQQYMFWYERKLAKEG